MKLFLSLLSERKGMSDPIKPSGSGWELKPGPLAWSHVELPMHHSKSVTFFKCLENLYLSESKIIVKTKIWVYRPKNGLHFFFVWPLFALMLMRLTTPATLTWVAFPTWATTFIGVNANKKKFDFFTFSVSSWNWKPLTEVAVAWCSSQSFCSTFR